MWASEELRRSAVTPYTRRAFFRYWVNFAKEYPVARCDQILGGIDLIGQELSSTLQRDAEAFCRSMINHEAFGGNKAEIQTANSSEMLMSCRTTF